MTKNFVLDTNVLLHNPQAIFRFKDNTVILPIYVIEEIDTFKRELTELGRNAREVSRLLDVCRVQGNLGTGVPLENGGVLKVSFAAQKPSQQFLHSDKKDNLILAVALEIQNEEPDKPCIMITKDTNLRVRADALGLIAQNFEEEDISSISELYPGASELTVPNELIDELHDSGELRINLEDFSSRRSVTTTSGATVAQKGFFHNEYILLRSDNGGGQTSLGRLYLDGPDSEEGVIRPLSTVRDQVWGIRPRNKEQAFALDALLDDSVSLVTLIGKAGTGKT
ncbi:MAG: PhoH family protein, partial [Bradymonadaceae bacterium]